MGRVTGIHFDKTTGRYWVDKRYRGVRLRDHFATHPEAEDWLVLQLENVRRQKQFGERPTLKFSVAAARYLAEQLKAGKPSVATSAYMLDAVMPYIGDIDIDRIHNGSLTAFRTDRMQQGRKSKTINESISAVTTVLKRAASEWLDGEGNTWLERAPKLAKLEQTDARPPRPISWKEQADLMSKLPPHLAAMATFMLHTGARDDVVVSLQWDWEVEIPGARTSAFLVPKEHVKGRKDEKVLVLNSVAQEILERQRGRHETFVFVWRRERTSTEKKHRTAPMLFEPVETMNNTAWQRARREAKLGDLHVHDLRHTVGLRLRAAKVPERTIRDILWHAGGTITAHYSSAEHRELFTALERIKQQNDRHSPSVRELHAESRARKAAAAKV